MMATTASEIDRWRTGFRDASERIRQLERLNAALAAEIDRMRPVVQTAKKWKWQQVDDDELVRAVAAYYDAYEAAKEGGE